MKYLLIIILFVSCTSKIKVKRVIDGDTVVSSSGERIRLAYEDAPEISQFYGKESKMYLSGLILNKTVLVKRKGKGKYKRTIGIIYLNGLNVNEQMIKAGMCWVYKKYNPEYLYNEELIARSKRLGLWKYNNPMPPCLFRKGGRP